jgi:cytochrome d ubiquinol oxidase subunit I
MDDLLAGRMQMAFSLGFHIVFAVIGMVMPFLMAMAQWRYLKTGEVVYRELAKAWAKGVAIFFAIGAVSGTLLSFELGTLWPGFMEHAGPIIGMPFSLEGTAFFVEAIALGLFLYGWDKVNKWVHFGSGVVVGLAGLTSGILVVSANAWMNSPAGFDFDPATGVFSNIEPWEAMFNAAWFSQALHMSLAAFVATGFGVAGLHAYQLRRHPQSVFHRKGLYLAMILASVSAVIQPLSGHESAQDVAERQPEKLAAMEAHFETTDHADLLIGGIPNEETGTVSWGIHIPGGLSFLAFNDTDATVTGLNDFPEDERPPVLITHFAFQIMVGIGTLLALIGVLFWLFRWRWPERLESPGWLRVLAITAPLGFLAVEAGWVVTEVGRQPWIIYQIMRTAEALTPMPGLVVTFMATTLVYLFLGLVVFWLMTRQIKAINRKEQEQAFSQTSQSVPS